MSSNIYLVEYKKTPDGRLFEISDPIIEYSFAPMSLIDELSQCSPLAKREIYESTNKDSHYAIEYFQEDHIEAAINKLHEIFLKILSADSKQLLGNTPSHQENEHKLKTENKDAIDNSINRFRTITNVINIFKTKHNKYQGNDSVIIKIG